MNIVTNFSSKLFSSVCFLAHVPIKLNGIFLVAIPNEFCLGLWVKTKVCVDGKLQIGFEPHKLGCDVA